MPELPEVETMRRQVAEIVGCRVVGAQRTACRSRPILISPRIDHFRRRVSGRRVTAVDRVGKRVAVRLDNEETIVIEPRMTGLALLADPPTTAHLRFRLTLAGGRWRQLLYWDRRGLGSVRLLTPRQLAKRFGPRHLGPDALEVSGETLRRQMARSRRAIKVALMDQRALAGIGNLYASEILHVAGIHPQQRCDRLTARGWSRLHEAIGEVLRAAIDHEGSTLADGTYRNALNQAGGYQNLHRVYDRQGQLCPSCARDTVRRIVQAQRSTFFCPRCQRK